MVFCVYLGLRSLLHEKAEDRLLTPIGRGIKSFAVFLCFCLSYKTSLLWRWYRLWAVVTLFRSHHSLNTAAGLALQLFSHGVLVELTFVYLIHVDLIQVH